ncbi:MAG: stage V sporulation protein AC [Lachnospirales bacterium]
MQNEINLSNEEYDKIVKDFSPKSNTLINCMRAFFVGGTICLIAEFLKQWFIGYGITELDAGTYTSVILIFTAIVLTGLGIYQKLGNFAGAGSIVPITGFANSVASPAIEFKKEGYVLGVGAKIFIIAGPVILYGTLSSIIVGFIYYFFI